MDCIAGTTLASFALIMEAYSGESSSVKNYTKEISHILFSTTWLKATYIFVFSFYKNRAV